MWYILPIGWLYITYHLLREPETAIDFWFFVGFRLRIRRFWRKCIFSANQSIRTKKIPINGNQQISGVLDDFLAKKNIPNKKNPPPVFGWFFSQQDSPHKKRSPKETLAPRWDVPQGRAQAHVVAFAPGCAHGCPWQFDARNDSWINSSVAPTINESWYIESSSLATNTLVLVVAFPKFFVLMCVLFCLLWEGQCWSKNPIPNGEEKRTE